MKWLFIAAAIVSAWISGAATESTRPAALNGAVVFLLLAILFGIAAGLWK